MVVLPGLVYLFEYTPEIHLRAADVGRVRTILLQHSTQRASSTHKMDDSKMIYSLTGQINTGFREVA